MTSWNRPPKSSNWSMRSSISWSIPEGRLTGGMVGGGELVGGGIVGGGVVVGGGIVGGGVVVGGGIVGGGKVGIGGKVGRVKGGSVGGGGIWAELGDNITSPTIPARRRPTAIRHERIRTPLFAANTSDRPGACRALANGAEGVGFEPTGLSSKAVQEPRIRPLCHPSRDSETTGERGTAGL